MFSTLKKLFCFKKEPRTPLGFCDCPSGERQTFFQCSCAKEDRYHQPYNPENTFHEAVCMGKLKEALHLLATENFNVDDKDSGERTALHFACFYGHLDLVHFLLFNDSNIDALDKKKSSPLMKAVQSRETEIVSVLLDQGADPNLKDENEDSAIHMAVYVDSLDIVTSLLEFGADIEDKTKDGFTPLLLALRERKLLIAEYLITHGANVHARDDYERTTLMYAVKWDSEDLVDLLLKKGVDHCPRDVFRWSALMYAIVGKRQVKRAIVNHENSILLRQQKTLPEELELETMPDLKPENKDASDKNGQNLESSRKAAHSSTIGNDAEVNELNQVWAIKCLHPELKNTSNPIFKAEYETQQFQAELKEEMLKSKPEEENTFDKIEENQEFSVCDLNGLQEASTEAPHSSNIDNDTEKNERQSGMEDQRHTSEEEQRQHNGRKNKQTFIDAVRDFFCPCFTKNHSSSSLQKK